MTCDTTQRLAVSALIADCKRALPAMQWELGRDMVRSISAVERAFAEPPSNVVHIGKRSASPPLTPDQHWHRQLEAMSAALVEPSDAYLPSPNPVFKVGEE